MPGLPCPPTLLGMSDKARRPRDLLPPDPTPGTYTIVWTDEHGVTQAEGRDRRDTLSDPPGARWKPRP